MTPDADPVPPTDPAAPSVEKRTEPEGAAEAAAPPNAGATKPLLPIFKIRPVDPKNAFNFEDVADK